jgi:3-hydroxybutyryl-CoA dehydrogenase
MSDTTSSSPFRVERAAILGAGTMGHGIAQVAATSGMAVTLFDIDEEAARRGISQIQNNLEKGVLKGKITPETQAQAMKRLSIATSVEQAVRDTQLVIEAAPERLDLKRALFTQIEQFAPADAILGTNTSSLSISEIASGCRHPERVVGMHFFNPPYILQFLELIRTEQTDDDALAKAKAIGEQMNRDLIVINDSPGFATSRLGLILGLEAMRMLQDGVGSAEDIDRAMELGYRHPMGPLRLTDLVGLDVRLAIAEYLHRELGGERFAPPQILRDKVEAGKLGRKSGEGFYKWG